MAALYVTKRNEIEQRHIIPYRLLRFPEGITVGHGSHVEVTLGTYYNRKIAYKKYLIHPQKPGNKEKFDKEANMILRLNHPNIVHCFGVTTDRYFGIIMERAGVSVKLHSTNEVCVLETLKHLITWFPNDPAPFNLRLVCLHQVKF